MVYLKSIGAGIAASILSVVAFAVIVGILNRREEGMVGINILGVLPLTIALLGFAAGFYFIFRISK